MSICWSPHVTVATLVERDGTFLFVREHTPQGERINQPAGHWEQGETLLEAACRETLEETGWHIKLTGFVSVASYLAPANNTTYLRFPFVGQPVRYSENPVLDPEIIEPLWLTRAELEDWRAHWRSPLVADVLDQYLKRGSQPLELVSLHR